jgi:hypothetical protein
VSKNDDDTTVRNSMLSATNESTGNVKHFLKKKE